MNSPRRGELWVSINPSMLSVIVLAPRRLNNGGTMTWDVLITQRDGRVVRTIVCGIEHIKRDGIDGEGYFYARQLAAEGFDG